MLVQLGSAVVQFHVTKSKAVYKISGPIRTLCPYNDMSFYADEKPLGRFRLSSDGTLVAIMARRYPESTFQSHVWNLGDQSFYRVLSHTPFDYSLHSAEFLSVGHLYQVIMLKKPECIEVRIERVSCNGKVIQIVSVDTTNHMEISECASAHVCGDSRWLNSLSGSTSSGIFYVSKVSFPHGIQALIRDIRLLRYGVYRQ
jgi:hypothetical protein